MRVVVLFDLDVLCSRVSGMFVLSMWFSCGCMIMVVDMCGMCVFCGV